MAAGGLAALSHSCRHPNTSASGLNASKSQVAFGAHTAPCRLQHKEECCRMCQHINRNFSLFSVGTLMIAFSFLLQCMGPYIKEYLCLCVYACPAFNAIKKHFISFLECSQNNYI